MDIRKVGILVALLLDLVSGIVSRQRCLDGKEYDDEAFYSIVL